MVYQSFNLLDISTYVTLIQAKEKFHQGVGDVQPVVYQNHDDPILDKELKLSTRTYSAFSISTKG